MAHKLPDLDRHRETQGATAQRERHGKAVAQHEEEGVSVVAVGNRHGRRRDHDESEPEQEEHSEQGAIVERGVAVVAAPTPAYARSGMRRYAVCLYD
jgi:hypothetical protein